MDKGNREHSPPLALVHEGPVELEVEGRSPGTPEVAVPKADDHERDDGDADDDLRREHVLAAREQADPLPGARGGALHAVDAV